MKAKTKNGAGETMIMTEPTTMRSAMMIGVTMIGAMTWVARTKTILR